MKPRCPCCGNKNEIIKRDCGYSTFNPSWYECPICKFRVDICFTKQGDLQADSWDVGVAKAKIILKMTKRERDILGFNTIYDSIVTKRRNVK